jgi:transcriptional regulator with XRE-family HTH domain
MELRVKLRTLRKARGMTQVQLAERVHVTQGYIARLEIERTMSPSLRTLRAIAKALGVPVRELVE